MNGLKGFIELQPNNTRMFVSIAHIDCFGECSKDSTAMSWISVGANEESTFFFKETVEEIAEKIRAAQIDSACTECGAKEK